MHTQGEIILPQSRRDFLKSAALAGGGLVIGFHLPAGGGRLAQAAPAPSAPDYPPDAFIRIAADNTVTIVVNKAEMGQGVYTALPMLINEELGADWSMIRVEAAGVAPVYNHTQWGAIQGTGGSSSVASSWEQMRRIGATCREMLVSAAAANWRAKPEECVAENGRVNHLTSGASMSYGELADLAMRQPIPTTVTLKKPSQFTLIGKPTRRLDTPDKTNGKAQFGIDVYLPGMLTAVVARAPVFGAKVKSFDAAKAKTVPGVKKVVQIPTGVAVIATGYWPAKQGRDALEITWDDGPGASLSSEGLLKQYADMAKAPGAVARATGKTGPALEKAVKTLDAEYHVPFLAHAPMEPLNTVVELKKGKCTIWSGTQFQTIDRNAAAEVAGLKPEQVEIHTTFLGGGFGRRANPQSDFIREAVSVAKVAGAPVKVLWSREDDIQGGYYRPMWYDKLRAGLDESGMPVAWEHHIVGQSIIAGTAFAGAMIKNGVDATSVEGAADLPYTIPNVHVALHTPTSPITVQWWRSVGHSHTAFVVESFLDELAHAAGKDPLEYRRALLTNSPRELGVLNLAAEKAGWGTPLPEGRARGLAVHSSFDSFVAQVAEVSMDNGELRVHKVVCAVDCGMVVNPDTVVAQMESGIVYGLSAALYGKITLKDGKVEQSNFHDYRALRLAEMPVVETHIVPSTEAPTGVGEPGTPPIAPAVANALFALTGNRLRSLPLADGLAKPG